MPIWTTSYLARLEREAEEDLAKSCNCIVDRLALDIQAGQALYQLPDYVIGIRVIRWKGYLVIPLTEMEQTYLFPNNIQEAGSNPFGAFEASAFEDTAFNVGPVGGAITGAQIQDKPEFYGFSGSDFRTIQFFGTPGSNVAAIQTNLWGVEIPNRVIVEFFRLPETPTHVIPSYFRQEALKNYVLWRAFAREGPGQRLDMAAYYRQKFEGTKAQLKSFISGLYLGQIYVFDGNDMGNMPARPRAMYPANYGIPEW